MDCLRDWWKAVVVRGASESRAQVAVAEGVLYAQRVGMVLMKGLRLPFRTRRARMAYS